MASNGVLLQHPVVGRPQRPPASESKHRPVQSSGLRRRLDTRLSHPWMPEVQHRGRRVVRRLRGPLRANPRGLPAVGAQWVSSPPRRAIWLSCYRELQISGGLSILHAPAVNWGLSGACGSGSPLAETACPVGRPVSIVRFSIMRCRVPGPRTADHAPDGGHPFREPIEGVQSGTVTDDQLARDAVGCGRGDRRK
jgi:hypothetical protein